jgi:hypothetical protein
MIFLACCFGLECIPAINPGDIMSLNGAICCFFVVYIIPIAMHFKCYYGKMKIEKKKDLENDDLQKSILSDSESTSSEAE